MLAGRLHYARVRLILRVQSAKTTVFWPLIKTRSSRWRWTARASTPALDVAALARQGCGGVDMAREFDVLRDDRSFIEVFGDIVRGCANQLHPARVRLMIGTGALEGGKQAVVNVDAAAVQRPRHVA